MKTLIKPLFFFFFLFGLSTAALAQITPEQATKMKDGVFMNNGRLMQIRNGQLTEAPAGGITLAGTRITSDGTAILKNGQRKKLKSGYAVNSEGNVVLLQDDMFKADAIEEHSKEVLGNTETVIVVSEEGTQITQGKRPVSDTTTTTTITQDATDYKQIQQQRRQAEYMSRINDLQLKLDSKRSQRRTLTNNKGKIKKKNQDQARQLDKEIYDLQEQINKLDERMRSE